MGLEAVVLCLHNTTVNVCIHIQLVLIRIVYSAVKLLIINIVGSLPVTYRSKLAVINNRDIRGNKLSTCAFFSETELGRG